MTSTFTRQLPGVLAAFVVMLAGFWLADRIGQAILAAQGLTGGSPVSGVPVAIVLGLLLRNTLPLPASLAPGLKFATTTILRAGIVLVGIRLSLFDVLKLGIAGLPVVLAAIATGLVFVTWFNKKLGLPPRLGTLIAAGTSICGVTAIVSVAPAIEADEREVAYAVANVVAFGLFGMLAYPYLAHSLLGSSETIGLVSRHRGARHLAGGRRGADLQAGVWRRCGVARGDRHQADAQYLPGRGDSDADVDAHAIESQVHRVGAGDGCEVDVAGSWLRDRVSRDGGGAIDRRLRRWRRTARRSACGARRSGRSITKQLGDYWASRILLGTAMAAVGLEHELRGVQRRGR